MNHIDQVIKIYEIDYKSTYAIDSIPKKLIELCVEVYLSKDFDQLLLLVSSQARIWLFVEIEDEMDDLTYFQWLGEILTVTYFSFDPNLFIYLLNHPNRDLSLKKNIMSKKEQAVLDKLPSDITIFRGNLAGKEPGFSWSLSKNRAMPFARRHFPHHGELLTGICRKSKIIAYFSGEREILIDPKNVEIQTRIPIKRGNSINSHRINHHDQIWNYMKKSGSYKAIQDAISVMT